LAFTRPSKKLNSGDEIYFSKKINAKVLEKRNFGEAVISFNCDDEDLNSYIQDQGKMPLPPYILKSRDSDSKDFIDYQTVYAKNFGSVAAPTAGLHFDHTIIKKLKDNNQLVEITLHVGSGTFQPIRDTIESHQMHSEYGIITEESASKILKCKKNGGRVISVGTTTLRLIETGSLKTGEIDSYEGETDIFIKPGFNFNTVDLLLTNFHLPKSTLLLLVSAFAGTEKIKKLYDYAINMKYRFFSYGDVTLLYRK
jgi:S-adenosylmethionine:tRNA ribosyltransferase-isomerase